MSDEKAAAEVEDEDKQDADEMSGDGGDDGDDGEAKQEWVKKEYIARPYTCTTGVLEEVEESIIRETRPLISLRISRPRREFGQDGFNFIDKDGTEFFVDLKGVTKNILYLEGAQRKVIQSGFQAASQIKSYSSQTYFGRSVNKASQYEPEDFMGKLANFKNDDTMEEKLDKFIDRVAFRVEEALQSNEIINVFQDDFEMLADEAAAQGGKINSIKMTPRTYSESEYCHLKRVSCIKFHPNRPYLVAMSMIEYLKFHERAAIAGKSFESNVLIMNFSDAHIITLAYVLETPIEISSIEFHPQNSNALIGGCLNGQIIVWDISSTDHRIAKEQKRTDDIGGDGEDFTMGGVEDDDKQESGIKMKHLSQSSIIASHKNFVADIQFIPPTINVDKRNPSDGQYTHFLSVSEDGIVNIWDTRPVDKEALKRTPDYIWKPFIRLDLFKQDGSGELGLCRALIAKDTTVPTFWAASEDGDLVLIDWSVKPVGSGDDGPKFAEYVKFTYESEKEYRPALALERSPFFYHLILTVHNFHFAIWKVDLENYEKPIFQSAPTTQTAHNTCGGFSPTRPGVIFITKTDGIDVWDFLDGSNKPSVTLNFATSVITYMKFQYYKHQDQRQYMAYGDEKDGTLFLWEVPTNLRFPLENELENIERFWDREVKKCLFVIEQRERKKEEYSMAKAEKEKAAALAEQAKEIGEEVLMQRELEQEEKYQEFLLDQKKALNLITDEELAALQAKKKKK